MRPVIETPGFARGLERPAFSPNSPSPQAHFCVNLLPKTGVRVCLGIAFAWLRHWFGTIASLAALTPVLLQSRKPYFQQPERTTCEFGVSCFQRVVIESF